MVVRKKCVHSTIYISVLFLYNQYIKLLVVCELQLNKEGATKMGILTFIIPILIFSITILTMKIVLWLKTKKFYVPDVIRLTGAIICLISSCILLGINSIQFYQK